MAKLLFKLNNVPEEEAEDVRQLLAEADIEFYETSSGMLGLSFAAIWLNDEDKFTAAKQLINDYQAERYARVTEEHRLLHQQNLQLTRWAIFKRSPIKTLLIFIFVGIVSYLTISPFFI